MRMANNNKKLYIKEKGVRFRKSPDTSNSENIISNLLQGQELILIDGPWMKVKLGDKEGWVHGDYITEANPNPTSAIQQAINFVVGSANLVDNPLVAAVRKIINDEFGGGRDGDHLNCTEYIQYRVKTKFGIDIKWPVKAGRNGGKWADIFQQYGLYKILTEPQINCAMCFTAGISTNPATNAIGHIAFVEDVLPDGSVKISEANWPPPGQAPQGQYSERTIPKEKWQNQYKARFVLFT